MTINGVEVEIIVSSTKCTKSEKKLNGRNVTSSLLKNSDLYNS